MPRTGKKSRPLHSKLPLVETQSERERRNRTYQGQASWAIGPQTCRECLFWENSHGDRFETGVLKEARCQKATLLSGSSMAKVPYFAESCKYFDKNPSPPDTIKRRFD